MVNRNVENLNIWKMKVAVFSANKFELDHLNRANSDKHELRMIETYLSIETASLAQGCECVSLFVNDDASERVLEKLKKQGIKYLALRSAGYNHVDVNTAKNLNLSVANAPGYSPYAIAEHAIALMLALNRKITTANNRVREQNFSLNGLTGFDMHGKSVGIIGTGKIGAVVAKILHGFGCKLYGFDSNEDEQLIQLYGLKYVDVNKLCELSDIITLQIPLNEHTRYIINAERLSQTKKGVMLINTSRGGLVDTRAVISALKSGQIGYLGLDVYEEEKGLFFEDHSEDILQDDVIARLMTFRNVLITSHQAFLTETALQNIAETTIYNVDCWENSTKCENLLRWPVTEN